MRWKATQDGRNPRSAAAPPLQLFDGLVVETVGIPADDADRPRLTVCVSSQVGLGLLSRPVPGSVPLPPVPSCQVWQPLIACSTEQAESLRRRAM